MRRIILDTDLAMGTSGSNVDDGFALGLALADPDLSVELVTTVRGNTDVDTATRLAHELLARVDRGDVPVRRGAGVPLNQRWLETEQGAADEIVGRILAEPGELTIVAIGPLTNVATALMAEPRIASAVQGIVVMGGAFFEHTNVLAMPGERNFWTDPDAADLVLTSGAPIRLVGLEVTDQIRLNRADTEAMAASDRRFASFAARCADEWIAYQQRAAMHDDRARDSCAVRDALAVAVVAYPDLVTWRAAHVRVEASSALTRGVAIADLLRGERPPPANCRIAVAVDAEAFRRLLLDRIASLP